MPASSSMLTTSAAGVARAAKTMAIEDGDAPALEDRAAGHDAGEVQRDEEDRQHEGDADDDQQLEDEVVVVRRVVEGRRPSGTNDAMSSMMCGMTTSPT